MFHTIRSVSALPDYVLLLHFCDGTAKRYDCRPLLTMPAFSPLEMVPGLFQQVTADVGGYGVCWNDEIDIDCEELYANGVPTQSPFSDLLSFHDATSLWQLNESTLRKAVSYGKLADGVDVQKFGKQWLVTRSAMLREYGQPPQ